MAERREANNKRKNYFELFFILSLVAFGAGFGMEEDGVGGGKRAEKFMKDVKAFKKLQKF